MNLYPVNSQICALASTVYCLYIPRRSVGFARLHSLAGLLDLLEDGVVVEGLFGDDLGRLGFERDVV
jgi:hypothetical protein